MSGVTTYTSRVTSPIFSRAESTKSKAGTIASGQVLKKHTFLQSNSSGKLIAHTGMAETAQVDFTAAAAGLTVILGGLTFTVGASGITGAQLATAWSDIANGTTAADATTAAAANGITAAMGTFTAGTMTGWNTSTYDGDSVTFNSVTALTNVTDLAATGTGAASATVTTTQGLTTFAPIAGMTIYDVNAASADLDAEVYTEAAMWDDAIQWFNTGTDTVTNDDGTTTACTAYNTGTTGADAAATKRFKLKFTENSEFRVDFLTDGEVRNV